MSSIVLMQDRIEILSVDLLETQRPRVMELKKLARWLGLEFGWHYLLDLTWVLSHLRLQPGMRVMDAGAGVGLMQWYLAEQGAEVLSVDRQDRSDLPVRFRMLYSVRGWRAEDLTPLTVFLRKQWRREGMRAILRHARDIAISAAARSLRGSAHAVGGCVILYHQDLGDLQAIAADSLDAVVAISSLEHNSAEHLTQVVKELLRVLKPGGVLLATLGAARQQDWLHTPSKGWCYTEETLRRVFQLSPEVPSNFERYDELFEALRNCRQLREDLASFYYRSGDNGMPWGIWDPQYQPVGVCKVKQVEKG